MENTELYLLFGGILLIIITFIFAFYGGAKFSIRLIINQFLKVGFDARTDDFSSYNKYIEKGNIVFVGDSITQEYNTYEYFDKLKTYNRGIGGDDTVGIIERINSSVFDLEPSQVVLLIGTNDLAYSNLTPLEIAGNITKIVKMINKRLPKTKVHVLSLLPVNRNVDSYSVLPRTNKSITIINKQLKKSHPNDYIDIHRMFINNNNELDAKYTRDGLHINEIGFEMLTEVLLKHL